MAIRITFMSTVSRMRNVRVSNTNRTIMSNLNDRSSYYLAMAGGRAFSKVTITPNLKLNTPTPVTIEKKGNSLPKLSLTEARPLIVLLEYLNAKEKHMKKFIDLYINHGFDVLQVFITPWQLLWPKKGCQVVAKDVAQFLVINESFSPLIVHGFSVGAYLWGEVLVHFSSNAEMYQPVADRIKCKIFDSPVDLEELPHAFPRAVFPNTPLLKTTVEKYINFHLNTFYEGSTKHFKASREHFSKNFVKSPTLILTSNADPFSSVNVSEKVKQELTAVNIDCTVRVFEGSPHVMHFKNHQNEYEKEIEAFFTKVGIALPQVTKAKL